MDIVEEFLELGRNVTCSALVFDPALGCLRLQYCNLTMVHRAQVSVTTLVAMLGVLRKRVPGRFLPSLGLYGLLQGIYGCWGSLYQFQHEPTDPKRQLLDATFLMSKKLLN